MMKKGLIFLCIMLLALLAGCEFIKKPEPEKEGKVPTIDFTIDAYYQDGAVIQQKRDFVIKGQSEEGVLIKATLYDQNGYIVKQLSNIADANGDFRITMSAPEASFNEYRLILTDSVHTKKIEHLLFGEVWMFMGERMISTEKELVEDPTAGLKFLKNTNLGLLWCDETSNLIYNLAIDLGHKLLQKLNMPVAIIDATLLSGHADAWLNRDVASKHKVILNYLTKLGRDSLIDSSSVNCDEPGAMYQAYLEPLKNHAFRGIWWSQGESDFKDITEEEYLQTSYIYSYLITQIFSDAIFSENSLSLFTIQENYEQKIYSNALRNAQATCAYSLNNMGIIPTYDLVEIIPDEEDPENEPAISLDYPAYVNRIYDITYENAYRAKKNYFAPAYVNIVANQDNVTISFNTGVVIEKVDQIASLVVLDSMGEEIEYSFTITNNYLYLTLELTIEQLEAGNDYTICYAQDESLYLGNLKATTGIPVLPFIISINE